MEATTSSKNTLVSKDSFDEITSVLRNLIKSIDGQTLLYELVEKCKDSTYEMKGNTQEEAKKYNLMYNNGQIHIITKNIILFTVKVEGDSVVLRDSVASNAQSVENLASQPKP